MNKKKAKIDKRGFLLQVRGIVFLTVFAFLISSCESESTNVEIIDEIENTASSKMFFSTDRNGFNELYLLENNKEVLVFSDPNYDYWWPKVSPDKSKMLVYRSAANPEKNHDDYQEAELVLAAIDGSNAVVIIEKGKHGWSGQGVARWNKDGSRILMIAEQNTPEGKQWRMVTTDNEGNNPQNLSDWWIIDPNFSIDNTTVVFMAFPDNELSFDLAELELHQADYDSESNTINSIKRLTENHTRDHDPSFSPDGKKIVFSAGNVAYTNVDLKLFNIEDETEQKLLDDSGANGGSMCWSLDGSEVYFHSLNLSEHPFQIKKIDVKSQEVTNLLVASPHDYGYFHPEVY